MHYLFNKKTFLGFVSSFLFIALLVNPGRANKVAAEGGSTSAYLPVAMNAAQAAAADTVFFGPNATWKYDVTGTVPGTGWNAPGFNDSNWPAGSAPLGFGNGNERTVIGYGSDPNHKYITTYFRKTFSIADAASVSSLAIDLVRDDGAVVYLNGKEVARSGMPSGTIGNSTLASSCIDVSPTYTIAIDRSALVTGSNNISVEVHQCSSSSGDLTFGLALHGMVGSSSTAPTATAVPTKAPTAQPTVPPTTGNSFYVTTGGSSSGDGSMSHPWSLAYALSQPAALHPGDTIWVRGGTYSGSFTASLKGSSSAPITVRAYPGERATLRNANDLVVDIYGCQYVNFWGLEIAGSETSRDSATYPSTYGVRVNQGVSSSNVKFINMVVHDVQAMGFGWWQALTNSEIYGSLIYFNGTGKLDHGVYVHNVSGTKYLTNNLIFDNASHGIHGYAETADKGLNNLVLEGNTLFDNGSLGGTFKRNILLGGLTPANNPVIRNNHTYYPGSAGESLNLGYSAGSSGAQVSNNYFAGGAFELGGGYTNLTMSGNTTYAPGGFIGFSTGSFAGNTWTSTKPSGVQVFVQPNQYETNRANLTIYNWSQGSTVTISAASLSGVALQAGHTYELHNAQNFYGDVVSGVYNGSSIVVPMTGHSVAQPAGGYSQPASTFPEFGAFILIGK